MHRHRKQLAVPSSLLLLRLVRGREWERSRERVRSNYAPQVSPPVRRRVVRLCALHWCYLKVEAVRRWYRVVVREGAGTHYCGNDDVVGMLGVGVVGRGSGCCAATIPFSRGRRQVKSTSWNVPVPASLTPAC